MFEWEILDKSTGRRWLAYGYSHKDLRQRYPDVNWKNQFVLGSWYID